MKPFDVVLLSLVLLLTACAPSSRIASNRADNYPGDPKRLYVVTDIGTEFGDAFFDAFDKRFQAIVTECGATTSIGRVNPLELNPNAHLEKMTAFSADALLSIRRSGGTRNQTGIIHVVYDTNLIETSTQRTVWRSQTNFYRGMPVVPIQSRAEALAIDLTNKLKEDKIFSTCPAIKTQ